MPTAWGTLDYVVDGMFARWVVRIDDSGDQPPLVEKNVKPWPKLPDGRPLTMQRLIRGGRLKVEYRKRGVERILEVDYGHVDLPRPAPKTPARPRRGHRPEELEKAKARLFSQQPPALEVNAYTFLPYLQSPPDDRFTRPRHRTRPQDTTETTSGRVRLSLEVVTPLAVYGEERSVPATHRLLPSREPERLQGSAKGDHAIVSLARAGRPGTGGHPRLPGASIKGVLRTWYEAITSSTREIDVATVSWRDTEMPPQKGERDTRQLGILQLHGRDVNADGRLPAYRVRDRGDRLDVTATITPCDTARPGTTDSRDPVERGRDWLTELVEQWRTPDGGAVSRAHHGDPVVSPDGTAGQLAVGVGVGKKRPVGVRVALTRPQATELPVPAEVLARWADAQLDEAADDHGGPTSQRVPLGDGRQVEAMAPDPYVLVSGHPVFYTVDGSGSITYLGMIRSGRWSTDDVAARVPTDGHPATPTDDTLDPAQRVFGLIGGRADEHGSWAGRLRVESARWTGPDDPTTQHLVLKPLMAPKIQAAGAYLNGTSAAQVDWRPGRPGQVSGSKVYWHQPPLEPDDPAHRVQAHGCQPPDDRGEPVRLTTNRTVEALTAGSFTVDIWFEDLDVGELGALLLACSLRFTEGEHDRGWKLGLGKPLGLGSLRNRLLGVDEVTQPCDPTDPGITALSQGRIDSLIDKARDRWVPNAEDRAAFDAAASHDTVQLKMVGYPGTSLSSRGAEGFKRWSTALEVADGRGVLAEDGQSRRGRGPR